MLSGLPDAVGAAASKNSCTLELHQPRVRAQISGAAAVDTLSGTCRTKSARFPVSICPCPSIPAIETNRSSPVLCRSLLLPRLAS